MASIISKAGGFLKTGMFYYLILLSFTGCSEYGNYCFCNDPREEGAFEVTLHVVVNEDDIFELFYKEEYSTTPFSEERKLRKKVKGRKKRQEVRFKLPPNVFLGSFRLDLGVNSEQREVFIDKIVIKRGRNEIDIPKSILNNFFIYNKFVEQSGVEGKFTFLEINGKRDPFIISRSLLNKKIEIEF